MPDVGPGHLLSYSASRRRHCPTVMASATGRLRCSWPSSLRP